MAAPRAGRKPAATGRRSAAPAKRAAAKRAPARRAATPSDPVTAYARGVLAGIYAAGKLVRLACERHLRDLEGAKARGFHFDAVAAERAIQFFSFLQHSKGEWAGKPVTLEPWQQFIVGSVWGWRQADGTRRFRTAYNEIPRKNGKSTMAAGIGLELLTADGEPGAEIYCAATKRAQALIVWNEARRMVEKSPALKKRVGVYKAEGKENLHVTPTHSKMEPLGADAETADGLNIHGSIVDELHAHKNREMVDVLETGTGARRQPLNFYITTAGYNRESVCWEFHDYAVKVLEGILTDDTFFAYIATVDQDDDWTNPEVWAKANPNLGVSVKLDDLQRKCHAAKAFPAKQNGFKRLHLNIWTEQATRWIDTEAWDKCAHPVDRAALRGRRAYGGLDLSSTTDLSSLLLLFPPAGDDPLWSVLPFFWVPKEGMRKRVRSDRVPYDVWVEQGLITATEGNIVDYDVIRRDIGLLSEEFDIRQERYKEDDDVPELAYDRWNATQLVTQLQGDGFTMVPVGMGFASMAAPMRELEKLIVGQLLAHGGHPVLRWMASNVAASEDPAGNLKPDKAKSSERIDGIVGLCLALARAVLRPEPGSVYDEEDLFFL